MATENDQKYKSDSGKPALSLVPTSAIRDIAHVRMFAIQKYKEEFGYQEIGTRRFTDALFRHLLAFIDDSNSVDDESGLPHYMHIACNAALICEKMNTIQNK